MTSNLVRRIYEHRQGSVSGFTQRYGMMRLVWFERHDHIEEAIKREKAIKNWPQRAWRVRLIVAQNPAWDDLFEQFV